MPAGRALARGVASTTYVRSVDFTVRGWASGWARARRLDARHSNGRCGTRWSHSWHCPALVLLRLLPHLIEETGAWAFAAFGAGYFVFSALEARTHGRSKNIGLAIVLPTLAIHGFLDGTGLALAFKEGSLLGTGGPAVGVALVVHKIPEGLFVASALLPALGVYRTSLRLGALALATVFGALSGRELLANMPEQLLHVVVALGLGVLLRMATHRHDARPQQGAERLASGLAFVVSLASLLAVPDPQRLFTRSQFAELSALHALAPLLLETAPWLLLALLIGEGVAYGKKTPDGVHAGSSMWLPMVALSLPLLGPLLTVIRALLEPLCTAHPIFESHGGRWQQRAVLLLERAAPRAMHVLPSYAVAVGLAIALEASAPRGVLEQVGWVAIAAAALLAALVPMRAAGGTVLVAVLIHKGLLVPAAVMFTCVSTFVLSLQQSTHSVSFQAKARALLAVAGAVVAAAAVDPAPPPLHGLATHSHHWIEWVSAAALASWALFQTVIAGPRAWFALVGAGPLSSRKAV